MAAFISKPMTSYQFLGKIGEGTYGIVFLGLEIESGNEVAIKAFKTTREGEGLSLTACREISLLRELRHKNVVALRNVQLGEDNALFLVFDYAALDIFDVILRHRDQPNQVGTRPPSSIVKSILFQLLNGLSYLHDNWCIHRDLKPSNILLTDDGVVKIADFGLARLFQSPLRPLSENGVVVTIWYRAPELLLGARHYTRAVDVWAAGCIFAELIRCRPLFMGKEIEKPVGAFQSDQVMKVFKVLGRPTKQRWPRVEELEHWSTVKAWPGNPQSSLAAACQIDQNSQAFNLLSQMLEYDPEKRITAANALSHPYFQESPVPSSNVFLVPGVPVPHKYPRRKMRPVERQKLGEKLRDGEKEGEPVKRARV